MRSVAPWALSALLAIFAAGCGDDTSGGEGGGDSGGTTSAETTGTGTTTGSTGTGDTSSSTGTAGLEVPGGPGTAAKAAYPDGPFGIGVGSVVPNFTFVGYTRPGEDMADLEVVQLADFYNPTGAETFPMDGRAWQGQPKPKALAVSVAAFWCAPCRQESRVDIPEQKERLGPLGGEFLLLLSDGEEGAVPPVIDELNRWISMSVMTIPAAIDPATDFQTVWDSDAFPQNVLIRTSDMRIIDKVGGVPTPLYWAKMEQILNGTL